MVTNDRAPKVADIDDEDNILTTKIKLTKNEYNATIRNKLEYNRLKVIKRHLSSQCDLNACKIRTSAHDLKKWLDENQQVVCNINEFFVNRKTQSAAGHYRARMPGVQSSLSRVQGVQSRLRAKSASTLSRPYTAPLQTLYEQQTDFDSDDESVPIPLSRLTSSKFSKDRSYSVLSTQNTEINYYSNNEPIQSSINPRITWPVSLKVFALQDENEARKQFLAWRAEQRKSKARRSSKTFFDSELERQYRQSIQRRQDIEAYVTPELVDEHKYDDPIFAKRYRQLKLAVRSNRLPVYDPADCEIHVAMSKSKIERARSALITAKETKLRDFYRNEQARCESNLSHRINTFIERVKEFKKQQNQ